MQATQSCSCRRALHSTLLPACQRSVRLLQNRLCALYQTLKAVDAISLLAGLCADE